MSATLEESTTQSSRYYQTNPEKNHSVFSLPRRATIQGSSGSQEGKPSTRALLEGDMNIHLKLPTFKGVADEDMDFFWFMADSVWMA